MADASTHTPLRVSTSATQPMRRMFVSRSSLLNPSPLLRCVRTTSPSSFSSFVMPRSRRSGSMASEIVVLPAPESPVNQTVNPCCSNLPVPLCFYRLSRISLLHVAARRRAPAPVLPIKQLHCGGRIRGYAPDSLRGNPLRDLDIGHVEAALRLVEALPAAAAGVIARLHCAGAVRAADAGEAAIVQRVVGDAVVEDVLPDLRLRPCREGV